MSEINKRSQEELLLEIQELRAKLTEAEETLRAIRSGEIDALVVSTPQGDQVFTLKGAERPYRILMEKMKDGAVTLAGDDTIFYCNQGFADMLKNPLEKMIGTGILQFISPVDRPVFEELIRRGRENSSKGEITFLAGDETAVPTYLSVNTMLLDGLSTVYLVATDITERKLAEEALQKAHDELEIKVEERTRELVGANEELHVEITERKQAEEALQKAHDELEIRVQKRTAELSEANKKLLAEIEERKRAEEATQEAHKYAESIVETLHESLVVLDTELRVKIANQTFYKIFKVTPEETLGKLIYELGNHQWDIPELRKLLEEIIPKDTQFHDFEVDHEFPDIGRKTMLLNARRLYQEGNTAETILLAIEDITERKQAEEKIREQATLLDNAQEAVGVRSLEHRIIYWNKGAQRLYGWIAQEAIGKNADKLLYKEETPQLIEAKRIVLEKGEWTGELHQVTKDNTEVIVESHWTLIYDSEGKPKSILIINIDITEKKMFEAHLLRAQRMESIGILAGGIAHNLNNMLTPMMLSLKLLKEKFTDEHSQRILSILEKNSERSADLIKQVLSFSRGIEGERAPLAVKYLITEIEKIAKETFPKNIEFRTDIPKDLFTICGDVTQLHQVIMNLCVNARDAMPDGGILKISCENCFIDDNYTRMHTEAKVGSYVAISVSDTGIGIPPKILDRIFEPFFTTKEFGKGTGLGLSTSLAIVKSHSGFIDMHSKVGAGSMFRVYLPAINVGMQNVEEQQLELLKGQGELILIAEDEDSVRETTCSALEQNGYRVLTASDGVDAIALYAQNIEETRVILMDMMMPVMDGKASIRAIRKISPEIKVIAVSGLAEKDKLEKIADTHVHAFLPKPYTTEKLLKTIHEVLSMSEREV